jgi:hypothetical protein
LQLAAPITTQQKLFSDFKGIPSYSASLNKKPIKQNEREIQKYLLVERIIFFRNIT